MDKNDFDQFKQSLTSAIDFRAEYETLGVRIVKQTGNSYLCHCPFHEDKEPSFSFFADTGHWKCFAQCGHGTFFDVHVKIKGGEFKDVLRLYAGKYNVRIPSNGSNPQQPASAPKEEDHSKPPINPELAEQYHHKLLDARDKLDWLITGKRGLTLETIKKFQIGWNGKRYSIPVRDDKGIIRNIRLYDPEATNDAYKMISLTVGNTDTESPLYGFDEPA
jgi:DNA primase